MCLVSGSTRTVRELAARGQKNLGILLVPDSGNSPSAAHSLGLPYAADNSCYTGFNEVRFVSFLKKLRGLSPLFVTSPDKVGNAFITRWMYRKWRDRIRSEGFPVAYVLQDGQDRVEVPDADAYFIGGSTEFKLSEWVRRETSRLISLGKWVHMGRVNSLSRLRLAHSWGISSIDGTGMSMFGNLLIRKFCNYCTLLDHGPITAKHLERVDL